MEKEENNNFFTFGMIKPDGVEHREEIIKMIYAKGLKVYYAKACYLTDNLIEENYSHCIGRDFYPEMKEGKPYHKRDGLKPLSNQQNYGIKRKQQEANTGTRYPDNLIEFSNGNNKNVHPTQKPVPLLEYLIKTYTNEGDLVLDNCMGSGSTGVACVNLNRKFIGIELDENYFNIAKDRINKAMKDNDTV